MKNKSEKAAYLLVMAAFGATMTLALAQTSLIPVGGGSPMAFAPVAEAAAYSPAIEFFASLFGTLTGLLGGLFWAVIVLALLVELILLYPSVSLQIKQKKIHLFHKKIVDRFGSGELSLSQAKSELPILYAANRVLHRRAALLFAVQLAVFLWVLLGLRHLSMNSAAGSLFESALLSAPSDPLLPLSLALAYFFHSLIKIRFRQQQDYLSPWQSRLALFIAFAVAMVAYSFSSAMPVLLSVYAIHLVSFATFRYLWVERHAEAWGKTAQKQLIHLLKTVDLRSGRRQAFADRLRHSPFVRHFNLHLLEEAASMSLAIALMLGLA